MKSYWRDIAKVMSIALVVVMAGAILILPGLAAQDVKKTQNQTLSSPLASVFMLPRLFALPETVFIGLQRGDFRQTALALKEMARWFAYVPLMKYDIRASRARREYSRKVLVKLSDVFEHSFRRVKKIPRKSYLEARKRYAELSPLFKSAIAALSRYPEKMREKPSVRKVINFKAMVAAGNTGWDPRLNVLKIFFRFDEKKPQMSPPIGGSKAVAKLVNSWYERGLAAGNYTDLYDNRDGGHSRLQPKTFPQLSAVIYDKQAQAASVHYGLNSRIFFNAITIGNSSTALVGKLWRSQPRFALTSPGVPSRLYRLYRNNHLYFYPEHRDHDPKYGDVLPANTPYMIISQGSSGSDQPFLQAVASILAAFRPGVKQALKKAGLVMPTVQMIFRRGQKGIESDRDYLSGKAHPSVFKYENMDVLKMVTLAQDLDIEHIPPLAGLKVVEESATVAGLDSIPAGMTDRLFDTPAAIARVVRSVAYDKRMLVRAASRGIGNGRKATYRWVVLRGDGMRIKFIPKNADNSLMEIIIPWHERAPVPGRPELTSDRVDIGVFADDGGSLSAPAFISLIYPGNQKRVYSGDKKILSVDYQFADFSKRYTDPLVFPSRKWRDTYTYNDRGQLIGWKRQANGKITEYTRDGAIVVERDDRGRAIKAQKVAYLAEPTPGGRQMIMVRRLPEFLYYGYDNAEDMIGHIKAE